VTTALVGADPAPGVDREVPWDTGGGAGDEGAGADLTGPALPDVRALTPACPFPPLSPLLPSLTLVKVTPGAGGGAGGGGAGDEGAGNVGADPAPGVGAGVPPAREAPWGTGGGAGDEGAGNVGAGDDGAAAQAERAMATGLATALGKQIDELLTKNRLVPKPVRRVPPASHTRCSPLLLSSLTSAGYTTNPLCARALLRRPKPTVPTTRCKSQSEAKTSPSREKARC